MTVVTTHDIAEVLKSIERERAACADTLDDITCFLKDIENDLGGDGEGDLPSEKNLQKLLIIESNFDSLRKTLARTHEVAEEVWNPAL